MNRRATRTRTALLASAIFAAACGPLGGPVVTEPMPDIPETVEYDTVRIEYGDDDLLSPAGDPRTLVGDPSPIAAVAQAFVRGTNSIIRAQIALIEAVTRVRPTEWDDDIWIWDNAETRRTSERYSRFEIRRIGDDDIAYEWRVGNEPDELLEVFSGEFSQRAKIGGRQRGSGLLRFNFTNMHQVDETTDPRQGRVVIAFRSAGGVRQVRVASFNLVEEGRPEPRSGLYDYIELPDAGRFRFAAETDFLKDGEPLEHLSIDAVWTREQAGRALASLTGGSLLVNEVLLHECWDDAGRTTFADATPDVAFPYEDGEFTACSPQVADFELRPPVVMVPQSDPEIPAPHPDEDDEAITDDQ